MTINRKLLVLALVLLALALGEQFVPAIFYYSRLTSTTQVDAELKAPAGDLVSSSHFEKPLTRWLPFIKFGESVFYHTYQHMDGAKVLERDATTRTRLLVLGLCSTAKYDELARGPFEEDRQEYLKRMRGQINKLLLPTPPDRGD